jgi:hypothetical protein
MHLTIACREIVMVIGGLLPSVRRIHLETKAVVERPRKRLDVIDLILCQTDFGEADIP